MTIRARIDSDLDALVDLSLAVQANDGYPGKHPRDFRSFLAAPDALGSWVAEHDGEIVGHVALHASSLPVVMNLASSTLCRSVDELGVVARLLVSPTTRRAGLGRALLEHAADDARARGLHPILDVVTDSAAIALYDACGWSNAGEVTMRFSDDFSLQSYVYVAP